MCRRFYGWEETQEAAKREWRPTEVVLSVLSVKVSWKTTSNGTEGEVESNSTPYLLFINPRQVMILKYCLVGRQSNNLLISYLVELEL